MSEISNLKQLAERAEIVLLTEKVGKSAPDWVSASCMVPQVNRKEILCFPKLIWNSIQSVGFLLREKPDAVISIGALSTIPVCLLAKLAGKQVIYIESCARTQSPSQTGKFLYKIADTTIVQWEALLRYYPNAIYGGLIY